MNHNMKNLIREKKRGVFYPPAFLKKAHALMLFLLLIIPLSVEAEIDEVQQQSRRNITGIVTNAQKAPLPGVTVQVVGRQGGVIIDADGR